MANPEFRVGSQGQLRRVTTKQRPGHLDEVLASFCLPAVVLQRILEWISQEL